MVKAYAIDCEMVGVKGGKSELVEIAVVNEEGKIVLNTLVKPKEQIIGPRTWVHGITRKAIQRFGQDPMTVIQKAWNIINGSILIGHDLNNDLKALGWIDYPKELLRDTSIFQDLRFENVSQRPSLKKLAHHWLKKKIQDKRHSATEDARACMELYVMFKDKWEAS